MHVRPLAISALEHVARNTVYPRGQAIRIAQFLPVLPAFHPGRLGDLFRRFPLRAEGRQKANSRAKVRLEHLSEMVPGHGNVRKCLIIELMDAILHTTYHAR